MPKTPKILIFCMIFVVNALSAQQISPKFNVDKPFRPLDKMGSRHSFAQVYPHYVVPGNFSLQKMSFFCRQEKRWENLTGVPFKFRLGSVQYVDWLEQKPNSWLKP